MKTLSFVISVACLVHACLAQTTSRPGESNCEPNPTEGTGICTERSFVSGRSRLTYNQTMMNQTTATMDRSLYENISGQMNDSKIEQPGSGREEGGAVRRQKRQEPVLPWDPYVSYCNESCDWKKPYWVWAHIGFFQGWVPVVQIFPWFQQWAYWCNSCDQYCHGKASSGWQQFFWSGKCVREIKWKKFLVVYQGYLKWAWVKVPVGCCCVPYNYA